MSEQKIKVTNNSKQTKKQARKDVREVVWRAIIGIGKLLFIISVVYSVYVMTIYINQPILTVGLIPQIILAVAYLIDNFVIQRSK